MTALISVIVPVYNTVSYLEECVQSVLRQTYANFELILVDDGSDDGSGELCDQLGKRDRRIHVLHQEHKGVSAARNAAISFSKHASATVSKYLFFLDSDDLIHPELLQTLCALALETDAAIVSSDIVRIKDGDSIPTEQTKNKNEFIYLDNQAALYDFFVGKKFKTILWAIGGKLLRREELDTILFDETLDNGEDTKFLYQLLVRGVDITIYNQKWYYYRYRATSASRRQTSKKHYDHYLCYKYIASCELAGGRNFNAAKMEKPAVNSLIKGYHLNHLEHNRQTISFGRKLAHSEAKSPVFSLTTLPDKMKFYLAFNCYPLYRFLYCVLHVFRKG